MKFLSVLLVTLTGFAVHASTTLNEFKCVSATNSGTVVTVKGCYQLSDDSDLGSARISSCAKDQAAVVGIQAKSKSGQIKQQFLPANELKLQGIESFQVLTEENSSAGKFELYIASDNFNSGFNKLVINVQNMNYSFKVVGCDFTYLGEIK